MGICFGEFVLDSARRELRRGDQPVRISPKALQLLELLISERSRAVSKDEIRTRLWRGIFVSETSLARLANEVRTALVDNARKPRFVRTVHGFGYSFSGEVAEEPPGELSSGCRLAWGNRRIPLPEGESVLGRAPDLAVTIDSTRVSRHHARITVSGNKATLVDLGSKNGTFLGGRRIDAPTELVDGDEIEVGPAVLVFQRRARNLNTTETT